MMSRKELGYDKKTLYFPQKQTVINSLPGYD
jgi:hypothetical protein